MPGEFIPNEADLALELGCARTTVNRALRAVAETGLLDRRRKVGTKVTTNPVRKATISIPIIRQEIEDKLKEMFKHIDKHSVDVQDRHYVLRMPEEDVALARLVCSHCD